MDYYPEFPTVRCANTNALIPFKPYFAISVPAVVFMSDHFKAFKINGELDALGKKGTNLT